MGRTGNPKSPGRAAHPSYLSYRSYPNWEPHVSPQAARLRGGGSSFLGLGVRGVAGGALAADVQGGRVLGFLVAGIAEAVGAAAGLERALGGDVAVLAPAMLCAAAVTGLAGVAGGGVLGFLECEVGLGVAQLALGGGRGGHVVVG